MKSVTTAVLVACGCSDSVGAAAKHPRPKPVSPFEIAEIRVEANATDGDTEVVIVAKGGDDGFRQFSVRAPDGRYIVSTYSFDPTVKGQRELLFESPEPPGEQILAAYPRGVYRFTGQTHEGERFVGTARLSHLLPPVAVITHPAHESKIPLASLIVEWAPLTGVSQILLELENESADPEQVLTYNLSPTATRFEVPAELLAPGASYQLSIGTVAANGNRVFSEIEFETQQ
jgi:hypothetical protein